MTAKNLTRRDAVKLIVGAGAMFATARFFTPLAAVAKLPDGDTMTVQYSTNTSVDNGVLGRYKVNVSDVVVICPHAGVSAPPDGSYTAYDLDEHLELLENPCSGEGTPRHSAANVLKLWKMFAYYGWGGPGYSQSWWDSAMDKAGIQNSDSKKWRICTIMHCGMSYYWIGKINGFFLDSTGLKNLYSLLREKNDADGNPSAKVRMFMVDSKGKGQEVVFWDFSRGAYLSVKKEFNGPLNREFHFTVTYSGKGAPSTPDKFTLKNGQTWTSDELPIGTGYEITEAESDLYQVTWIGNRTGILLSSETVLVTCVNESGYLQLEKDVTD